MSIVKSVFDKTDSGREIFAYTMTNKSAISITILDFGGIINKLMLPDRDGNIADCICGFDTYEGYLNGGGYQGALIGRYCNRIANGTFNLGGKKYTLANNENGVTHLHGGNAGFNVKFWDVTPIEGDGEDKLVLNYVSADNEEGYPGRLEVTVTYTLCDCGAFTINYQALSDRNTVCNLTNHAYFNLGGYNSGTVLDHELMIAGDYITEMDEKSITTGKLIPVGGTAFDFRSPKKVGRDIDLNDTQLKYGQGYDHNYTLSMEVPKPGAELKKAAELYDPKSGRGMELFTNSIGVQLYTGNMMNGDVPFKGGYPQTPRNALCLETQFWPDSPNHPEFPSCELKAGNRFDFSTRFKFYVK